MKEDCNTQQVHRQCAVFSKLGIQTQTSAEHAPKQGVTQPGKQGEGRLKTGSFRADSQKITEKWPDPVGTHRCHCRWKDETKKGSYTKPNKNRNDTKKTVETIQNHNGQQDGSQDRKSVV